MTAPYEMNRRAFMKTTAAATATAAVAPTARGPGRAGRRPDPPQRAERHALPQARPDEFLCSRLVFGGGAALMGGKAVRLLNAAFDAGVNFYDLGSNAYYKGSERPSPPSSRRTAARSGSRPKRRCVPSTATTGQAVDRPSKAVLADYWTGLLNASLADLGTDYVDAYYLMGVGEPEVVRCEQLHEAFLKAKQAGKVGHWGVSTHKRAQQVLEAMIGTGWYDLAMIAITPAGWYDWDSKSLLPARRRWISFSPRCSAPGTPASVSSV
jgi:Predicted oxidoreductases of the aldo/keto reductase family